MINTTTDTFGMFANLDKVETDVFVEWIQNKGGQSIVAPGTMYQQQSI